MESISLVTFAGTQGHPRTGLQTSRGLFELTGVAPLGEMLAAGLPPAATLLARRGAGPLPAPRLLLPWRPGKVIAVGRNYAQHARELGNEAPAAPFFFLKAPSTAIGTGETILIPRDEAGEVHHEAELAVVIGRRGKRIPRDSAMQHVAGYTCANDVTARTLQRRLIEQKLPWFAGKNADTFLAFGPGLAPSDACPDPASLRVQCFIDGERRQDAQASEMVHDVAALVSAASQRLTLEPGDLILTGTPAGVGPIRPGQTVEVRIEGVGSLVNPVALEPG